MRLIDYFDKGVALGPERPFLVFGGQVRSYGEVQAASHRIAHAILKSGVRPGDRVAVLSANSAAAFECVLGLLRAGCVWVPANARNVVEETAYQLGHADVELLFYGASVEALIPGLRAACPGLRQVVPIQGADGQEPGLEGWAREAPSEPVDQPYDCEDLVALIYTGGTTGTPKGAMHTHRSYEAMTVGMQIDIGMERPVFLVTAPMTHAAGGLVMCTAHMGGLNVVLPAFDPTEVLDAIERHRVTHVFLPPTAIYMLLAEPRVRQRDLSSLRCMLYAGAPIFQEKLKEALAVFGPVMCQGYAQTEALPNLAFLSATEHVIDDGPIARRRLSSCGKPTLMARIVIKDDDGHTLPPNERGEICAQSLSLMKGYFKDPQQTALTIRDGWLHTGDIGYLDEDGYLYVVDRKKDMIVSGGFNIYPAEVEQVISRHPDVLDCAVIGVPDEKWGEAVKAVVQLKPGAKLDEAALETYCRELLNVVKVPKSFDFIAQLPRSPVGKVLKRVLRDPHWAGRERKI